ncbi:MAG: 50S ribosomal protein L3 [Candidatus Sericytochromatia bacterium]|uniref:Large ribosomal subunit protein uL3 n=1 Tax=Candidatus Tanganyikabacteria bacterium TaxID=2961651 RepID=A0A937X722_9BACT|nr:50S ribosomal protein L3 [Candidatus Tanganyikabacteria bacterium]
MALGILGQKLGMTQIFDEKDQAVPVTVVAAGPCIVTQVKTKEKDGYNAIQVGFGETKPKALAKGERGHLKPVGKMLRHLKEFRLDDVSSFSVGQELKADLFSAGQTIDVVGTSIGKGFQGMQRRHHAGRGPMAHGSKFHRHPGSIGAGTTPSRVYKGASMPGKMGNERVTVRKLTVARVDADKGLILIKGAVPGAEGGLLIVRPAKKVGR